MSPATAWGSATENKSGGGNDPNVLKLGDQNRIRLLDAEGPRKWRQHGIDGEVLHRIFPSVDENLFRSATCPRGPDGNGSAPCPLDMKPSYIGEDGKVAQLFPISVRYAANVWDYESESVKVLIAGKQVFAEFDAVAKVGFDPTACDFIVFKMGKDRQTSYKVVRGGEAPLPREIKPDDLHDLDKYEQPSTADKIFELLAEAGVDYDAIPLPEFTLEQALQFVMPYTKKAKGLTMEQLAATDLDFMKWLYGEKRSQGQYGDAVFQAMHVVLLDMGETTPLDEIPKAPPRAQVKAPPTAPANGHADATAPDGTALGQSGAPTTVTLVGPDGTESEVDASLKAVLLAAGFTEKAPEPEPEAPAGLRRLLGPDGTPVDALGLPEAVVAAILAGGGRWEQAEPEPEPEPADDDEVVVDIGGTKATLPYAQAKGLIASGAATLLHAVEAAAPAEPEPAWEPPAKVQFKLKAIPVPVELTFAETVPIFASGQGDYEGDDAERLREHARRADSADDKVVARDAATGAEATDPPQAAAAAGNALDKALTQGPDANGRFTHPAIPGKDFATKGAVTQALKRMEAAGPSAGSGSGSTPTASAQPSPAAAPADGKEAKLERAKDLLGRVGGYMDDFDKLMTMFDEVAGKRNIGDFNEAELDKLVARLEGEEA